MRFHGTLRRALVGLTGSLSLAMALPAHASPTVEAVKNSPAVREMAPSATEGYVGWTQNSVAHRNHVDAFIQPDGRGRVKVNAPKTEGWSGGFDTDGTTFVFQQISRSGSDLKRWNVATGRRRNPPSGVNSKAWEWAPTMTDTHLLFGRIKRGPNPDVWEIRLLDLATGRQILIEQVKNNNARVQPGQVSGDFVVYDRFVPATGTQVWRYQISTQEKNRVPRSAPHNYAPSVTPDGNVYHARSRDACGAKVRIVRWDGPGTTPAVLYNLPQGTDTIDSYTYVDASDSANVLFDRFGCGTGKANIYKLVEGASPSAPSRPAAEPYRAGSAKIGWPVPGSGGS